MLYEYGEVRMRGGKDVKPKNLNRLRNGILNTKMQYPRVCLLFNVGGLE